jgi:ubiquinone/menaquinone biosynthesis C-methylase UbiE
MIAEKASVRAFWDTTPCGTRDLALVPGSKEFFEAIEQHRYRLEPFIGKYARFAAWKNKKVLEVGCGVGTDLLQFARAGASVHAVDLSPQSLGLAQRRLELYGYAGDIREADAEVLPFEDNTFDLVYSWGVIHHTPAPPRAVREIHRVLKPHGHICIMVYHRYSLFVAQAYLACGLFSLQPLRSVDDIVANHVESPGTRVYNRKQAAQLFQDFSELTIETVLTPYDARYGRGRYFPAWMMKLIPNALGWFMVVRGQKLPVVSA